MRISTAHTAVFDEKGRILMALGRDIPLWVFPGGHVEDGEESEAAARRELLEEVGIEADDFELVGEYVIGEKKIKRFYRAKASSLSKIVIQEHEVREARWFEVDKLPREMRRYDQCKIEDLLRFDGRVARRSFKKNPNYDLWPLFLEFPVWMCFVMFCYGRWWVRRRVLGWE